jgi:spore coat protein CotH
VDAPGAGFPFDSDEIFDIALDLPPASVDALEREGPYVPATFRFAGYAQAAGVRFKGSSTFDKLDGKPSFKISFSTFEPDGAFLGVERLTLNAMRFDPTMLREAAAYRLFAQAGVPAPRQGYARLTINDTPYGLYSLVETLDENFLSRVFPEDDVGNLYDSKFISSDLTSMGSGTFELQEGDPATAGADLAELVAALDQEPILDVLDTRFDRASALAFLAVELTTPNWDGYARNTNNFLLYHAMPADRWHFVPWGQDTAFRGGGPLYGGVRARVATACLADEACRTAVEDACREVLRLWEEEDLLGWTTDRAAVVGPACAADPRRDSECDQEGILEVLAERPAEVRRDLP